MIPRLTQLVGVDALVKEYLQRIATEGFSGDIDTRYAMRLAMATDNSIYQMLPQAVLFPKSNHDVCLIAKLAIEEPFRSLSFTPRGGGTGTNGQALNNGLIVDLSRYMNRILEFNQEEGWIRVEAGVIKDQLNQYVKPYGYFFSPELSTSNRATLGGMINTDASGQGSLAYGKTSDHLIGLKAVILGGEILETQKMPVKEGLQRAKEASLIGNIYQTVLQRCQQQRQLILQHFPPLNRFLTGYDLRHVYSDDMEECDLSRILAGSEGTLAFITEAVLHLTPIPKIRRLINIKFNSFDAALKSAPAMLEAKALSVETIDSKVFNLARQDIIWESVKEFITDVPGQEMKALNLVEYAGDDEKAVLTNIKNLCQILDRLMQDPEQGVIGYQICSQLSEIEKVYAMRKKAVGLLGNSSGRAKPIPFIEDTCVPPQHLAEYISEFRQLLDQYHIEYGMFGHVDAGVLHVRPALDMCDPLQEKLIKTLSDQIVALTAKYGGLLWGEHGKGFRSMYSPAYFGETLYHELRVIKTAFDPYNQLNPGKICEPVSQSHALISIEAEKRGTFDRQIPIHIRQSFRGAMECNGNGLCFNFDINSPMCPSMRVSADRIQSPKGRATLVREWLRLLVVMGVDPTTLEQSLTEKGLSWRTGLSRIKNTLRAKRGEYDFSHEVKEAMSTCLACKACASQCPIKIDVAEFRSRFLQIYHSRYLRPIRDYLVAGVESYLPLMAKVPKLCNFVLRQPLVAAISRKTIGMVDLPLLTVPTLQQLLKNQADCQMTLEQLEQLSAEERQSCVVIIQDPFTTYYEATVVADCVSLVKQLGFQPVLLPFCRNGKSQHIKGFLSQFAKTAKKNADILNRLSQLKLTMIGVDPALVLCFRDEYKSILGEKRGDFQIQLIQEWLYTTLPSLTVQENKQIPTYYLLGHCTETTELPHSNRYWQQIFSHFGATLQAINVGCCGMAGTYGHEQQNQQASRAIFQLSWQQALMKYPAEYCLATGYSCRSQVKRLEHQQLRHPLQALLYILTGNN